MLATIVNPSANTVQVLALIAAIVFGVSTLVSLRPLAHGQALLSAGLTLLALAIMWFA
jgi:hypothetical protein